MTTVEPYRPHLLFSSDAPSNARQSRSSSSTVTRRLNIPPAAPSPPPFARRNSPPQETNLHDHVPTFAMASSGSSQWLFTDKEILNSPSAAHGVPPEHERLCRAKGADFILHAGCILKLPQLTIATASIFFQRFYMRASLDPKRGHHHYVIAATALFLATKTEETCRKTKEIVIACTKTAQKNPNLMVDEQSSEYWRWRDNILLYEEMLLELLTFDLVLESPHNTLTGFLKEFGLLGTNNELRNAAWSFLNDGSHTTLCLSLTSRDIAIAALYFGVQIAQSQIPDDEHGNPWWERLGGTVANIVKGVTIVRNFYMENPLRRKANEWEKSPIYRAEDINRSRRSPEKETPSPSRSHLTRNGSQQESQSSNTGVNGLSKSTKPPQTNGGMERSASFNGLPKKEEVDEVSPDVKREAKDESKDLLHKAERGSGSSDAVLKEAANEPTTHVSEEISQQGTKRKESPGLEDTPAKRAKTNSDESSNSNQAKATAMPKEEGEESEEGELEE
ncbi:hypothetical protein HYALB_00004367 [Hymenoscyphus albidus]|uniref:RNA polymerase II holoenzyme cyclin-like subunit n=1 Tax=Hymenoscyphus albidus TaxID=595503 RepID=A0A9N9LN92_9HELO|nr:hypothetical protein HYALB_00004367 [Hymenoscyphus albidus]